MGYAAGVNFVPLLTWPAMTLSIILVVLNVILIGPIRRMLKKRAEFVAAQMGEIEQFTGSAGSKLARGGSAVQV